MERYSLPLEEDAHKCLWTCAILYYKREFKKRTMAFYTEQKLCLRQNEKEVK